MITPTNIRQHAQELIEQLPGSSLPQVVEFLEGLRHSIDSTHQRLPENLQEPALLFIIQRRLPPEDRVRLNYLRQQNESGTITEPEHQELLEYVDRVEQQDAERAEALINLSRLRNVDLKTLMNEYLAPNLV
jgi:DNA-binding GntR family transcriptional regulator